MRKFLNLVVTNESASALPSCACAFLSQIFDYGNTAIEKRAIFFRRLLPLLEFGREREGVDLSKVVLTHHKLKNQGKRTLPLSAGEPLPPLTDPGSGQLQEKEKARLSEIIEKVNTLFDGELSDEDKLVYVNHVLKGKLMGSDILVQQASNNTKEQFSNSPDLATEIMNAVMDALSAHTTMSKQALDSETVRSGLKDVLLGPSKLYESLRQRGNEAGTRPNALGGENFVLWDLILNWLLKGRYSHSWRILCFFFILSWFQR